MALLLLSASAAAQAETWIDSAENQLYCTRLASEAERAALGIKLGRGNDPAFWNSPSRDPVARLEKHLLVLGALAYEADSSNDQGLRQQAILHAAMIARKEQATRTLAMRQLYLCAHAALISSNVELDDPQAVRDISDNLVREYAGGASPGPSVEDLPLIHAIREAGLGPPSESVRKLAMLARFRAEKLGSGESVRAGRLLAAAAHGLATQGDAGGAMELARASSALVAARTKAGDTQAAWGNFPALHDSLAALKGEAAAARLADAMLDQLGPPPDSDDGEMQFAVYARLARYAQEALAEGGQAEQDWYVTTMSRARRAAQQDHHSVPFLRAALTMLESDPAGTAAQDYVWKHDRAAAPRDFREAYRPMLDQFLQQSQTLPIGDIRTRLVQQSKLESWLDTLGRLAAVLPADRAEIVDFAFKGLQLHSHSSVSAAAMKGFVRRSSGDPKTREDILRFLTMQADPSFAVRRMLARVYSAGFREPAADAVLRETFVGLDVSYSESTQNALGFRKFIWSRAPDLRGLILGAPGSIEAAQSLLRSDEALVALLPTDTSVLVFGISRTGVALERSDLSRTELNRLVRRLRDSVLPIDAKPGIRVKPFDTAASFELYSRTIGRIAPAIAQKRHLFWYSGPDLASIPPALLIDRRPVRSPIDDPAELAGLSWFADRHGVSVLPEPYLFWIFRGSRPAPTQKYAFVGIGAPQLSLAELQGARQARSMELAGGLDGVALANLPKLPEAADELRGLAGVLGQDRSALLLGPEASKSKVETVLAQGGDVISFATHGFVANEIFGIADPSLLLATEKSVANPAQSLLTAGEIADLDLNSRLVILSACNTATSDGRPRGASFTGLTQSFTSAGARALLVSHWPVASMAAAELSVAAVTAARGQKQELAFALSEAMAKFRTSYPQYAHPFYWAPFVLVGDGRKDLN
jgi:CHAT domain-containing protein